MDAWEMLMPDRFTFKHYIYSREEEKFVGYSVGPNQRYDGRVSDHDKILMILYGGSSGIEIEEGFL